MLGVPGGCFLVRRTDKMLKGVAPNHQWEFSLSAGCRESLDKYCSRDLVARKKGNYNCTFYRESKTSSLGRPLIASTERYKGQTGNIRQAHISFTDVHIYISCRHILVSRGTLEERQEKADEEILANIFPWTAGRTGKKKRKPPLVDLPYWLSMFLLNSHCWITCLHCWR